MAERTDFDKLHYNVCINPECKRRFSKSPLFISRKLCFDCWRKKNVDKIKSGSLKEAKDLYIYGTYEKIIRIILKHENEDNTIQRFEKLLKIKKFNLEKFYYKFREINTSHNKRIKIGLVDTQFYLEGCPFCHKEIKFDRLDFDGFNCPHCERFIKRLYHPIIKETKVRLVK